MFCSKVDRNKERCGKRVIIYLALIILALAYLVYQKSDIKTSSSFTKLNKQEVEKIIESEKDIVKSVIYDNIIVFLLWSNDSLIVKEEFDAISNFTGNIFRRNRYEDTPNLLNIENHKENEMIPEVIAANYNNKTANFSLDKHLYQYYLDVSSKDSQLLWPGKYHYKLEYQMTSQSQTDSVYCVIAGSPWLKKPRPIKIVVKKSNRWKLRSAKKLKNYNVEQAAAAEYTQNESFWIFSSELSENEDLCFAFSVE